MKRAKRILLFMGGVILLLISWLVVLGAKTNSEKQLELMDQAVSYMNDKVYILAIPLLEEAAGYQTKYTLAAETELKKAYRQMFHQMGYARKYTAVLEKQMNRADAAEEIFREAADYYLAEGKLTEALAVLKNGMEKTGSETLHKLYESSRYQYSMNRNAYHEVTAAHEGTVGVLLDGQWGLAGADGNLLIPCQYDQISTFSGDRMIVRKDGEIYAVDRAGNRLALLKEPVSDFGNYAQNRITFLTADGWKQANGTFQFGTPVYEAIGTYSEGYAAAKQDGKWGIIDLAFEWLVPPQYDEIIMEETGRSYGQGAVFVKNGGTVSLLIAGKAPEVQFEDARPFNSEGYAAVKKNGKWGFIDTAGNVVIDYQFDDAHSFSQHLAAVRQGDKWGYISRQGKLVIEPVFLAAKSFAEGSAPVLTEDGWQFITLLEYRKGAAL